MSTYAVSMVKDEADVIAGTILHMAGEVDRLIVADNGSTDGTREILEDLASKVPLTVLDDPEVGYYQSEKMTRLAQIAAEDGAEWIVPFDADELWIAEHRIADVLAGLPLGSGHAGDPRVGWVDVPLYNHLPTAVDPDEEDPFRRIVWRQAAAAPLPKVCFRWEALGNQTPTIFQGNHSVGLPQARSEAGRWGLDGGLQIRHFPARSAEQFVSKARNGAAAYRVTDLPQSEGAHWRAYGEILDRFGDEGMADVYREHWFYLSPTDSGLVHDPAPYLRWTSAS